MYSRILDRLKLAKFFSEIGNSLRQLGLALIILQISKSEQTLYLAESIESAGVLLSVIVFPFFIDQLRNKVLLLLGETFGVLTSALLIFATLNESISLLLLGGGLMMASTTFINSSYNKFFTIASKGNKQATRSNLARLQTLIFTGALAGLISSYFVIDTAELVFLFYIDLASYIVAFCLTFFAVKSLPEKEQDEQTFKSFIFKWKDNWLSGLRETITNKSLRPMLVGNSLLGVASGVFESTAVVHQTNTLGFSDKWVGITRACGRIGGIFGGISLNKFRSRLSSNPHLILGCGFMYLLCSIGLALFSAIASISLLMAGLVFSAALLYPALRTEINHSISSEELLGRVSVFRSFIVYASALFGNILVLFWGTQFGTKIFITIGGALFALGAFYIFFKTKPRPTS